MKTSSEKMIKFQNVFCSGEQVSYDKTGYSTNILRYCMPTTADRKNKRDREQIEQHQRKPIV